MIRTLLKPLPSRRIVAVSCASVVLLTLALSLTPAALAAGPFTVNTFADSHDAAINGICLDSGGLCSLRAAIEEANASSTPTTINLPAGTFNLTIGELSVAPTGSRTITIQSTSGPFTTIIHQTVAGRRVFNIDAAVQGNANVTLSGVTVSGGQDAFDHLGGAGILAGSVTATPPDSVTLQNCIITDNHVSPPSGSYTGQPGGGVQMAGGNLTVSQCTFSNNTSGASAGGAIAFVQPNPAGPVAVLSITGSTFSNNSMTNTSGSGPDGGGAIWINTLPANTGANAHTINTSTFTGNTVTGTSGSTYGGAIFINTGTLNVDHSTFTGNSATGQGGQGGAIFADSGTVNVHYARVTGNTAANGGNGIYNHTSNAAATNATNNWWGCHTGAGTAGCDTVAQNSGSALTAIPFITLSNLPSPGTIGIGQSATLTASFLQNSSGTILAPADVSALFGLPIAWQNAVQGTLSNQQVTVQTSGTATALFTAGSVGAGSAVARVDNGSATALVTILQAISNKLFLPLVLKAH